MSRLNSFLGGYTICIFWEGRGAFWHGCGVWCVFSAGCSCCSGCCRPYGPTGAPFTPARSRRRTWRQCWTAVRCQTQRPTLSRRRPASPPWLSGSCWRRGGQGISLPVRRRFIRRRTRSAMGCCPWASPARSGPAPPPCWRRWSPGTCSSPSPPTPWDGATATPPWSRTAALFWRPPCPAPPAAQPLWTAGAAIPPCWCYGSGMPPRNSGRRQYPPPFRSFRRCPTGFSAAFGAKNHRSLPWYAWARQGFDLDSDGGRLVTVADLAASPLLELVQVRGMDPALFSGRWAEK